MVNFRKHKNTEAHILLDSTVMTRHHTDKSEKDKYHFSSSTLDSEGPLNKIDGKEKEENPTVNGRGYGNL